MNHVPFVTTPKVLQSHLQCRCGFNHVETWTDSSISWKELRAQHFWPRTDKATGERFFLAKVKTACSDPSEHYLLP